MVQLNTQWLSEWLSYNESLPETAHENLVSQGYEVIAVHPFNSDKDSIKSKLSKINVESINILGGIFQINCKFLEVVEKSSIYEPLIVPILYVKSCVKLLIG